VCEGPRGQAQGGVSLQTNSACFWVGCTEVSLFCVESTSWAGLACRPIQLVSGLDAWKFPCLGSRPQASSDGWLACRPTQLVSGLDAWKFPPVLGEVTPGGVSLQTNSACFWVGCMEVSLSWGQLSSWLRGALCARGYKGCAECRLGNILG